LGRIPSDLSAKAGELGDPFDEIPDCDLATRADVDRIRLVVALGGKHDARAQSPA